MVKPKSIGFHSDLILDQEPFAEKRGDHTDDEDIFLEFHKDGGLSSSDYPLFNQRVQPEESPECGFGHHDFLFLKKCVEPEPYRP